MNFWPEILARPGSTTRSRSSSHSRSRQQSGATYAPSAPRKLPRLTRLSFSATLCLIMTSTLTQHTSAQDYYAQPNMSPAGQPGMMPASYGQSISYGQPSYPEYCPPGVAQGGYFSGAPQGGIVPSSYEQIPYYDELEREPLVDDLLLPMFKNMWIRTEYLHWNISDLGDTLLGAQVPGLADPSSPFYVVDAGGGDFGTSQFVSTDIALNPLDQFQAVARVFDTSSFDFSNTNGFRGTVGLDTTFGGLETSFFVLDSAEDGFNSNGTVSAINQLLRDSNGDVVVDGNGDPIYAVVPNVFVRPLTVNGVPSTDNILYYDEFSAEYDTQVWGTNSALFWNIRDVDLGFSTSALIGTKYLNVRENMRQRGSFTSIAANSVTVDSAIDSATQNHIFTPQVGMRTEFRHQYFTLGIEPRAGFGFNKWEGSVSASDVASDSATGFNDVDQTTEVDSVKLSPSFDLRAYASVRVRDHLTLTISYDFMWVGRIVRADEIIVYDLGSPSATVPSGVVAQTHYQDFWIDGLSLGAEFDW